MIIYLFMFSRVETFILTYMNENHTSSHSQTFAVYSFPYREGFDWTGYAGTCSLFYIVIKDEYTFLTSCA